MRIRFVAALGAALIAGSADIQTASAGGIGVATRPGFRGFHGCLGAFCRHGLVGGAPSAAFRAGFPGRSAGGSFAGGPSDDYAVDVDEGFGTDDAFRFDRPAASGPGNESRRSMPDSSDSYDPDAR